MNRVFMEGTYDCAAACMAMVFDLERACDAHPILGVNPNESEVRGVYDSEIFNALHMMGRRYRVYIPAETVAERNGIPVEKLSGRTCMLSRKEIQAMLGQMQTGCAIVCVPSLSGDDYEHFVYCERGEMHDPSTSETLRYNGSAKSAPVLMAIFVDK